MPWLHAVIDAPADGRYARAGSWGRALGWPAGAAWPGHPELRSFEPPDGTPYLHLQRIDDGPPRVHLDLEADDIGRTCARAVELGALLVAEHNRWRTLASPGGLPFCVVASGGEAAPGPVTWPGGHRSRMVQVCVDSPPAAHDAEVTFWRELLGERWYASQAPEFAGKWHDGAGSPLQLLFQRLEEDEGPVRAHLDHGTDDMAAEVARLLGLSATDVGAGRGWHVLRDVAGSAFCVTPNSPELTPVRDLG
jgi:hypothetical protein